VLRSCSSVALSVSLAIPVCAGLSGLGAQSVAAADQPNILVIVIDDVGIDHAGFAPFGWNATALTPNMPVFEAIAAQGVAFTDFWATPECSPTRAAMLTGRLGSRTGVVTAIIDPMIPAMQLNPAEVTLPKLLGPAGYRTAMLGKYHMGGGPTNTPPGFGFEAPATTAGLDFYDGYWTLPPSIDTTLGGQVAEGTLNCGGVGDPGVIGAACFPDGTCVEGLDPFEAMAMGATPLLDSRGQLATTCDDGNCRTIDFSRTNAYYSWPRVVTNADGSFEIQEEPQREYLTSFISRRTTEWVLDPEAGDGPWLAFAMHSSAHTPLQPPPPSLSEEGPLAPECSLDDPSGDYREQFRRMIESADQSVGEMLVDLGLAIDDENGFSLIDPKETNTLIIIFGDNGTQGSTVLPPFAAARAKQTVYQTGVWVPAAIAGPMVAQPGRSVEAMVNIVDLFGLIADVAGVSWQDALPVGRHLDAVPMLPYLVDPRAAPQREFNYAVYQAGIFPAGQVGPCIIQSSVVDNLFTSPEFCADNGGCWMGGASAPPYPTNGFCDLVAMGTFECGGQMYCAITENPLCDPNLPLCPDSICVRAPTLGQWAVRKDRWKLIVTQYPDCLAPNDCVLEFYNMPIPVPPHEPGLDEPGSSAQVDLSSMSAEEAEMFDLLRNHLAETLTSEWYCPGDGNLDFRVDAEDLQGLLSSWGGPGFWDINQDGVTDGADLGILLENWNRDCTGQIDPAGQGIPLCLF